MAAIGALVFALLFVVHHVLQGTGPASSSAADVAAYNVAHRGALLGSEVALGLGLLAFIAFLAPFVVLIRRAGQETSAVAVLSYGGAQRLAGGPGGGPHALRRGGGRAGRLRTVRVGPDLGRSGERPARWQRPRAAEGERYGLAAR